MKRLSVGMAIALIAVALAGWPKAFASFGFAAVTPVPGDPLTGSGNVSRTVLTFNELFSSANPAAPVDDGTFALPANAAPPTQTFQGRLELLNVATSGNFHELFTPLGGTGSSANWPYLPAFSFEFVQSGSHLIPTRQGIYVTGNASWNYIIGPGRVWQENGDGGYSRASFPFALVERNENCAHNGVMMFLFSNSQTPNISDVNYQITQETCEYFKANWWGQLSAKYTPLPIFDRVTLENQFAAEVSNRLPTKPISALTTDYPSAGISVANFTAEYQSPADITTYGLYINGTNYVSGCQTRFGTYAYCNQMRLPSYSVAKSAFASIALMRLGQLYGTGVYSELIKNHVPQYTDGGTWTSVTFENAADMATGNYISDVYEADENSSAEDTFIGAEAYIDKITAAFTPFPHQATPGTVWVYQSNATFILTQAMNQYLQGKRNRRADVFDLVRDDVFRGEKMGLGGLTTVRTDNSDFGKPSGYFGLYMLQDDVAKIAKLLNNDGGKINGAQILEPGLLQDTLHRNASDPGLQVPDTGSPPVANTYFYKNGFWAKDMTTAEFSQYGCNFPVAYMSGFGGITVLLMPNGATFYLFSDNNEFYWYGAINEANKIARMCP